MAALSFNVARRTHVSKRFCLEALRGALLVKGCSLDTEAKKEPPSHIDEGI
jgi:hypothetical protein